MKNTHANYLLTVCILITSQLIHAQTAKFLSNFEDKNTNPEIGGRAQLETGTSGSFEVVANPHSDDRNSSNYVLKVATRPGTGGRAEYTVPRHETNGKKYIYTWKRFHPTNMFKDVKVQWGSTNQWKTWPCELYGKGEYAVFAKEICYSGGIFDDMKLQGSGVEFLTRAYPDCNTNYSEVPEGIWNEFVLEIYWTTSDNGYYRIWRNGVLFGYGDNMKTLMNSFKENTCDIYWSNGLYTYWEKTGGASKNELIAYVDDIGLYDIDDGYTIGSICPDCEPAPTDQTDPCDGKINISSSATPDTASKGVGAINISVTGGDTPYTYSWNNGQTTQDISGLTEGTYTVTITGASGCSSVKSIVVNAYDLCLGTDINISGTVTPDPQATGDGSIDINVTGGAEPYTYSWSNGQTTQDISGLSSGSYFVTVTDHNGCTQTNSFRIQTSGSDNQSNDYEDQFIKTVYAEDNDGNIETNMIDNDVDTRWSSLGKNTTAVFVLKEELYVDSVGIFPWKNDIRQAYLGLSYSSDSVNWSPIINISTKGTHAGYEYFDLDATCKYVRLTGYGNSINDWTSILEFRVLPGEDVQSGLSQFDAEMNVNIYPNPTNGMVKIKLDSNNDDNTRVEVYSATGSTVYSEMVDSNFEIALDMSNYSSGVYLVLVRNSEVAKSYKLIKN